MLRIRNDQKHTLSVELHRRKWRESLITHAYRVWPEESEALGEKAVRARVVKVLRKASRYRIDQPNDIARLLNLTFLWGDDFEDKPEYASARELLESPDLSGRTKVHRLSFRAHKDLESDRAEKQRDGDAR